MIYRRSLLPLIAMGLAGSALATELPENLSDCEVLMMRFVADETGSGGMQLSTYGPAEDYIASAYDETPGHLKTLRGDPIRALLCQRDDVLPVESDYPLMATGIPFILSQDFDDTETDSLTVFWRHDHFDYVYKGYPLSEETEELLKERLAEFAARDHGLLVKKVKTPEVIATDATVTAVKAEETGIEVDETDIKKMEADEAEPEINGDDPIIEEGESDVEDNDPVMENDE